MARERRHRGLDPPVSGVQVFSAIVHLSITTAFYIFAGLSLPLPQASWVYIISAPLQSAVIGLWLWLGLVDPGDEGGLRIRCSRGNGPITRYCPNCRKEVPVLDAIWSGSIFPFFPFLSFTPRLNTCIGRRNYAQFYLLTVAGLFLYALEAAVSILCAAAVLADESDLSGRLGSATNGRIAWGVLALFSFWIFSCFGALSAFHSYLILLGTGTYDWVVLQSDKRKLRRREQQRRRSSRESAGL
ncbi:unnamed protein product, partial [Phaeothamnion confervicola]